MDVTLHCALTVMCRCVTSVVLPVALSCAALLSIVAKTDNKLCASVLTGVPWTEITQI